MSNSNSSSGANVRREAAAGDGGSSGRGEGRQRSVLHSRDSNERRNGSRALDLPFRSSDLPPPVVLLLSSPALNSPAPAARSLLSQPPAIVPFASHLASSSSEPLWLCPASFSSRRPARRARPFNFRCAAQLSQPALRCHLADTRRTSRHATTSSNRTPPTQSLLTRPPRTNALICVSPSLPTLRWLRLCRRPRFGARVAPHELCVVDVAVRVPLDGVE